MAITTSLLIGVSLALTQNVVYALPARACRIAYNGVAPVVSTDGTNYIALDADSNVGAVFIKSTGTTTTVKLAAF